MDEIVGTYCDETNSSTYVVLRRYSGISHRPLSGSEVQLQGSYEYVTQCGLDLDAISDELDEFEIIQSGRVIHRRVA